jgi:pimeloyl-ACP methyl ester carboxylesterase
MRVRSTDGVEVRVHDLGGRGPDLLLAHGTGLHGLVFAPLARHLTDRFRCWALDARAHGDSTGPVGRPLDWEGFADDVLAVVDRLGLDRPFGVGHSKGSTTLLLAEQRRPGTFRALYLYEPALAPFEVPPGERPRNVMAEAARRRRDRFPSLDDAYENFAAKPPMSTLHPDALRAYVEHGLAPADDGSVRLKCSPATEAEVYEHGTSHRAFPMLPEVGCPVTVALGDEEQVPAAFGRAIAERLPAATVDTFPDLGHFGPLQDPERIAASVVEAFSDGPAALS